MNKVWVALFVLLSAVSLAGCKTETSTSGTPGTGTTTPTTPTTPTTTAPPTAVPGVAYTMTLTPALTTLSAGGSTAVTATIFANGVVDTTQVVPVNFFSTCTSTNPPMATINSPVISSAGVAVSTYTDVKCASTDTVGASVDIGGTIINASTTITVQPATMGSIRFVASNPGNIGIKGVGLPETSQVQFQVMDVNGQTAPGGVGVTFSLDTTTGGVTFSPANTVTDANGLVTTTITSGTVPATVRVTATLDSNPTIKSQSDGLVISTGVSDQNSFSLSADIFNPEGGSYDGATVTLTVRASDHFNNPVPNGTAVLFTTEGGQIEPSCLMANGACTVKWTSQNPRPAGGRVTILATMTGEESFTDQNGDNLYDAGEPFDDLPEAWRNDDDLAVPVIHDPLEMFRDFNGDKTYTAGDGLYNGVLCTSGCGTAKSVDVRESIVLIMSTSQLNITLTPAYFNVAGQTTATGIATICDLNGQMPPKGTTFKIETNNGSATLLGSTSVPNSNANDCFYQAFSVQGDQSLDGVIHGMVTITATTPKGDASYGFALVDD